MTDDDRDLQAERKRLMELLFGFFPAQVVHTIARLRVAEHLEGGALPLPELASLTGTHEPSLYRLLRAAAGIGLVEQQPDGTVRLTAGGGLLRGDAPGSIRNLTLLFCGDDVWRSWGQLEFSVRTGATSYQELLGHSAFDRLSQHPEEEDVFTQAMAEGTRVAAPGIVASCDLSGLRTLADLGGGNGTLLAAFLRASPGLRGDAYLLKSVVHDWDDQRCGEILRNCRAAMPPDGTLLLVEPVLPTGQAALAATRWRRCGGCALTSRRPPSG